jgi:hypothetical protein
VQAAGRTLTILRGCSDVGNARAGIQDTNFGALTDAILERDQPRTSDIFHRMVTEQGRTIGDALSIVAAVQSVWYVPAGLDIWNQLLGHYPGRYASMKGMNVPPPDYGPVVTRGTLEERLHEQLVATISGDAKRSYGLFLGLAAEECARPALRDQIRFLGAIDMQETVIDRKARNTGHKSICARAITDLIDFIGWEKAHGIFYIVYPRWRWGRSIIRSTTRFA